MNEQLIVKNFGPIKDATVDFKRVTVFIGPTGGGKSTLAKLAAVFRNKHWPRQQSIEPKREAFDNLLNRFLILDYLKDEGEIYWHSSEDNASYNTNGIQHDDSRRKQLFIDGYDTFNKIAAHLTTPEPSFVFELATENERLAMNAMNGSVTEVYYIPADRAFATALESGLPGLVLKGIALPEALLTFLNEFKLAQINLQLTPLEIPFLDVSYRIVDKQARVDLGNDGVIELNRGASGIQAVIPMMLVINYNNMRHNRQSIPLSFIIEEPELNLYPTAQQGLLNWLVEKCTKGENDLTITTHSPYLLAHFNTLLFAYQVAQNHPERADEIAKIVPRESWLDPKEFAAYHVEGQKENGVRSIINPETGLISYNGLDAIASAEATEFEKLLDINAGLAVKW